MMPLEKRILNKLLDSYEGSKLSRGENKVAVHITYSFQKETIPEYFDESSTVYEEIHAMMRQLEERGFLTIDWKNKKVNHIIQKVTLCERAVPSIYQYLKRIPKTDMEAEALKKMRVLLSGDISPTAHAFLRRMAGRVEEGKSIKEYMDISNLKEVEELVYALTQTEWNKEECFMREFSIRHFHDSKRFEKLSGKVCRILREENPEYENMENEELLSEYRIYHNPGYVYLKGKVNLLIKEQSVSVDVFREGFGFAINERSLNEIRISASSPVRSVYTIENLTTFFRFERENSLILYLGGYHNYVRRALLGKIYEAFPEAEYYHFGDIDAGGFQIYYHLREKTGIPFSLYRMDLNTLKKYEAYGKKLTENDRSRLKKLCKTKMGTEEKLCVDYMLEHGVKLEQEAIENDDCEGGGTSIFN